MSTGEDVSFRDVKIKIPDRNWDQGMWVMSRTGRDGLRFWKSQLVEFLRPNGKVGIQTWARPDEFVCYGRRALIGLRADDVKAVSVESLCLSLSPHVEKPLNSKRWIKVSYLNQFRVFGFIYMFMNILGTLCLFHISVSRVCYNLSS